MTRTKNIDLQRLNDLRGLLSEYDHPIGKESCLQACFRCGVKSGIFADTGKVHAIDHVGKRRCRLNGSAPKGTRFQIAVETLRLRELSRQL
jgi:hypothetical protein